MTCPKCEAPMWIDTEIELDADHQIDPDQPRPIIYKCPNAHSLRRRDIEAARPATPAVRLCAVCGIELGRGRRTGKTCSPEHGRFVARKRYEADQLYRKTAAGRAQLPFRFPLEQQPWYRGAVTAFKPAVRPAPSREMPEDWWRGYQRAYGIESVQSNAAQRG